MIEFIRNLLDTSSFPPRWHCGLWSSFHGWFYIASDMGVFLAYMAIPLILAYFIKRRSDIPFRSVFWLFCAFIFWCGITHLMEVLMFWWPAYRLTAVTKFITAIVSWVTVAALIPLTPKILALPGLKKVNQQLEEEVRSRKEMEEKLQEYNLNLEKIIQERTHQVRRLIREVEVAEERERTRISRILHDELQQNLVAVKFQAAGLRGDSSREGDAKAAEEQIVRLMDDALQTTRKLVSDLRVDQMAAEGLEPALQNLKRRFEEQYRFQVHIDFKAEGSPSQDASRFLFRAVREILFNAVKHSQAREAFVTCTDYGNQFQIEISDSGTGFDPEILQTGNHMSGLKNIQQSCPIYGGTLQIKSNFGDGSTFLFEFPLAKSP